MAQTREIHKVLKGTPTMEGAGVRLNRVFGFDEVPLFELQRAFDEFRRGTFIKTQPS